LLPLDQIESATFSLAKNINRYLMRAVDMDVCRGGQTIFTYSKLGRFILLGFVYEPNLEHWCGTKVHANEGLVEPRKYTIPKPSGDYINQKARREAELLNSVSDRQQNKIKESLRRNVSQYVGSDAFSKRGTGNGGKKD
jgi:hypothetical protein